MQSVRPDEHMAEQKGRSEAPPGAAAPSRGSLPHQSARMMDAQGHFQKVVKQELQVLLASGMDRDVAVKWLLHRIVESTQEPEPADVKRVMKQFQMNHDDAVRALIVKQEIARLKRKGLDSFAAIEELTRKMQRVGTNTTEGNEAKLPADDAESTATSAVEQEEEAMDQDGKEEPMERAEEKEVDMQSTPCEGEEKTSIAQDLKKQAATEEKPPAGAATESAVPPTADAKESTTTVPVITADEDSSATAQADSKSVYLSSLSLCQRIGNVSISTTPAQASAATSSTTEAAPHDAEAGAEAADSPSACASPASSAVNSAAADPAPRSRKRRGAFHSDNSSSANSDSERESTGSGEHPQSTSSRATPHLSTATQHSSFSSNKKQKLHVDVKDSYLTMVSRKFSKEASNAPGATSTGFSTPPVSIDSENESLPSEASPSLRILSHHKRRRAAAMDDQSPILEDLSGSDHIIHHTKRHKS